MFDTIYSNSRFLIEQTPEEQAQRREHLMSLKGYIVLAREPGANDYRGLIEGSFSLDTSKDRTQFFWSTANATSNFGGSFVVDGLSNAQETVASWQKRLPGWTFEIFDARDDEKLPVYLDWDRWINGNRPADNLSGVNDKFDARNLKFLTKDI